jgi:hypothetical protein
VREATGDLWDYLKMGAVICVTVNGQVNRDGANIMGRGCAKEAKQRYPWVAHRIGRYIQGYGNRCFKIDMKFEVNKPPYGDWTLISFPTKHHWRDDSDPGLILQSAEQLVEMADKFDWNEVICPRFGAGNGNLPWDSVKEMLDSVLDDRFLIISHG